MKKFVQDLQKKTRLLVIPPPACDIWMLLFMKVTVFIASSDIGVRLRPAVPLNLVRETPPEGMRIAGHFVPGNV